MTIDLIELKKEESTLFEELTLLGEQQMGLVTREQQILSRISTIYATYATAAGHIATFTPKSLRRIDRVVKPVVPAPAPAPQLEATPGEDTLMISRTEQIMQVLQEHGGTAHIDIITERVYGDNGDKFKVNRNRMSSLLYNLVHKKKLLKVLGEGRYAIIYGK